MENKRIMWHIYADTVNNNTSCNGNDNDKARLKLSQNKIE